MSPHGESAREKTANRPRFDVSFRNARRADLKALVALLRQPGPATVKMAANTTTLGDRDRVKQLNEFTSIWKLK